jgi:hypothetical protein
VTLARGGTAPCGHPGTYITNTFIACNLRCEFEDAIPVEVDAESTPKIVRPDTCPNCGSDDIEPFTTYYFGVVTARHCKPCGRVFP